MKRIMSDERGMALAVTIFVLVVVGALVAGSLFVGTQEERVASNTSRSEQSFRLAELGGAEIIGSWGANRQVYGNLQLFPLDSATLTWTRTSNNTGSYSGKIYRLTKTTYLLDIVASDTVSRSGRVREGGAQQRVGVLVRTMPLQLRTDAALTVGARPTFGGGNIIANGNDATPNASWAGCAPPGPPKAGLITPVAADVQQASNQYMGSPPVLYDPTAADTSVYSQFGSSSYSALASGADIVIGGGTYSPAPVAAGSTCNTAIVTNWGDGNGRANPCGNYFPVIHVTGNISLAGGQGQGMLLVDGNLTLTGGVQFYGVIIVRGTLRSTAGGPDPALFGVVLAQNADLWASNASGNGVFRYSKCAALEAIQRVSNVALNRSRSWSQLY